MAIIVRGGTAAGCRRFSRRAGSRRPVAGGRTRDRRRRPPGRGPGPRASSGRPVGDDPAAVEHDDAREEVGREPEVVEDGDDRGPVALVEVDAAAPSPRPGGAGRGGPSARRAAAPAPPARRRVASRTSCRSPSDSSRASRPIRWPSPTRSIAAATAARSAGRAPRSGGLVREAAQARPPPRPASRTAARPAAARPRAGGRSATDRARATGMPVEQHPARSRARAIPARTRSSVDLPAPFGPTSATRSPCAIAERDVAQDRAPAGLDRDAVGEIALVAHSSYPVRARRRSTRKNGAPMIGRDDAHRDAAQEPRDEVGRGAAGAPRTTRTAAGPACAFGPDQEPDEVRHDEPHEPDQAGDRDARGGDQRGEGEQDRALAADVDAEVRRGLLARAGTR